MKKYPPIMVLLKGLATSVPGAYRAFCKGTGGTNSARYCYAVWMRHLILTQGGENSQLPKVVGELGPGDSIGIGLAALLSGVEKYFALDVVRHTNIERNLQIFEELVLLFKNKEKIPDATEFPNIVPLLDNYDFPENILTEEILARSLDPQRVESIRNSIKDDGSAESLISYIAPWDDQNVIGMEIADMIYSQFVLEHVNDLEKAYGAMYLWLKTGGMLSHVIDFQCHGTAREWNGHWQYSKLLWKLVVGGRPFLLNRQPAKLHLDLLEKNNFNVFKTERFFRSSALDRKDLDEEFKDISDEDLKTEKIYIQARK